MDIPEMRKQLKTLYPGSAKWQRRVDWMKPNQTIAIYRAYEKRGAFMKPVPNTSATFNRQIEMIYQGGQLC